MSGIEPTQPDYIRSLIEEKVRNITPQLGIVEGTHTHSDENDDSNYEVDVRLVSTGDEDEGDGAAQDSPQSRVQTHYRVPVGAEMHGASRGLQEGDMVLVQYLQGDSDAPIVTKAFYDAEPEHRAPITEEGDWRRQIGDSAVVEVITNDDGDQILNVGAQGEEDRGGLDMGLTMNIDEGSFSLTDAAEKGLFFDGDGHAIFKWESVAQPWGAAGPVQWTDAPSGGGGGAGDGGVGDVEDSGPRPASVSVVDSAEEPVPGATVTIERIGVGNEEDEGTTTAGASAADDGSDDAGGTPTTDGGGVDLGPEPGTGTDDGDGGGDGGGGEEPVDGHFPGDEATTGDDGTVEFSLPDDDYVLTVTYPEYSASGVEITGEITVDGDALDIVVTPDGVRSVKPRVERDVNEDGPVRRRVTEAEAAIEEAIVTEVNAVRTDADASPALPELGVDEDIAAVARWHSNYLGTGPRKVVHIDEEYGDHSERLVAANIESFTSAENLARYLDGGEVSPALIAEEIVAAWINSERHAENLFADAYDDHGVGVYIDSGGEGGGEDVYITHLFAGDQNV